MKCQKAKDNAKTANEAKSKQKPSMKRSRRAKAKKGNFNDQRLEKNKTQNTKNTENNKLSVYKIKRVRCEPHLNKQQSKRTNKKYETNS